MRFHRSHKIHACVAPRQKDGADPIEAVLFDAESSCLVAANGRAMAIVPVITDEDETSCLIPREIIDAATRTKSDHSALIEVNDAEETVSAALGKECDAGHETRAYGGKVEFFPDWKALDAKFSNNKFQPGLLINVADLVALSKALGNSMLFIEPSADRTTFRVRPIDGIEAFQVDTARGWLRGAAPEEEGGDAK